MKKTSVSNAQAADSSEMLPEYDFDYRQARPNRFAGRIGKGGLVVLVDPEVAQVFPTADAVNAVLRAIVSSLPKAAKSKRARKEKLT